MYTYCSGVHLSVYRGCTAHLAPWNRPVPPPPSHCWGSCASRWWRRTCWAPCCCQTPQCQTSTSCPPPSAALGQDSSLRRCKKRKRERMTGHYKKKVTCPLSGHISACMYHLYETLFSFMWVYSEGKHISFNVNVICVCLLKLTEGYHFTIQFKFCVLSLTLFMKH